MGACTGHTKNIYENIFSESHIFYRSLQKGIEQVTKPKPPPHLSKKAAKFFEKFVDEWEIDECSLEVLIRVCESQDRADQAAAELKKNGSLTTLDRFGVAKAHPAVQIERQARAAIIDGLKALGVLKQEKTNDRYAGKVF
jgi:phage terminase small subunit